MKPTLIYESTGKEVSIGDLVKTSDGETVKVVNFIFPHKPSSSGFVYVENLDGCPREYYVSVIGAKWINRTDR
jgi:hypothetical protein